MESRAVAELGSTGRGCASARAGILEGMDGYWAAVIWALLPTVVVLAVFVFVLRSILRMDRTERRAYSRIEAEERAKRGMAPAGDESASTAAAGADTSTG